MARSDGQYRVCRTPRQQPPGYLLAHPYYGAYSSLLLVRLAQLSSLDAENLTRIHDVVGVDRLLDCAHDAHRLTVLGDQKVEFAAADAVLACARAVER